MDLLEAKKLCISLMVHHDLTFDNWYFKWSHGRTQYGTCSSRTTTITLSKVLVPLMSDSAVRNTILHEIAHAIVGCHHGHNNVWKRKAIEIGCNGTRTNNHGIANKVQAKYKAQCSSCGATHTKHRASRALHACTCHRKRNPHIVMDNSFALNYVQQY